MCTQQRPVRGGSSRRPTTHSAEFYRLFGGAFSRGRNAVGFAPRILLTDEPLGALDRKLREQMQIEIMWLHRELGVSIVY
jgi:ABC-type nitrate/sulfonate/bicarbonate transport system ATPase subunit